MSAFGLEITPRPDLPAIVARWQREISVPELHTGYLAILKAADALGCWRWLLDLRRRQELATPAIAAWMDTEFLPRLTGRFAEPVRLAFLASPLRASQEKAAASAPGPGAAPRPNHGHQQALFTDEAAAYHWLAQ
ncbi:hypothetical protein [Hymenobacter sp.]|uniref:hypothetical protein n=1 Tax=Hymenobacter sp. TaxID=1898978 RepID=UPI00286C2581|nr:hypothetical protein [Hymenobacter sp.]